jgi:hypothetical protein
VALVAFSTKVVRLGFIIGLQLVASLLLVEDIPYRQVGLVASLLLVEDIPYRQVGALATQKVAQLASWSRAELNGLPHNIVKTYFA